MLVFAVLLSVAILFPPFSAIHHGQNMGFHFITTTALEESYYQPVRVNVGLLAIEVFAIVSAGAATLYALRRRS